MLFFVSQYCSRVVFFFKQKTAYEMLISDWSSDVCSSDLLWARTGRFVAGLGNARPRLWRQFRPQRISRRHRWAASFGRGLCTLAPVRPYRAGAVLADLDIVRRCGGAVLHPGGRLPAAATPADRTSGGEGKGGSGRGNLGGRR